MSAIQQMMLGGLPATTTLKDALTTASLTTNLKLCLDASDASSYNPSVQTDKWLDVSGGGYDFYLGSGTGGDAADPAFNGSAGYFGSYWGFDGGDYFTYDAANETWMQNLHKNNAIFSIVVFYYQDGTNDRIQFINTAGTVTSTTGIEFYMAGPRQPTLKVVNATAAVSDKQGDTAVSAAGWHMVGISLNEATGAAGGFFYSDGSYNQVSASNTFTSTYTSPAAGSASMTLELCGARASAGATDAGQKLSCMAIWEGTTLTKANMDTIWSAMRGRFGI